MAPDGQRWRTVQSIAFLDNSLKPFLASISKAPLGSKSVSDEVRSEKFSKMSSDWLGVSYVDWTPMSSAISSSSGMDSSPSKAWLKA